MVCAACGHENGPPARFCESCGAALSGGSEERRKVVTVLFCDVVGSTSLGESTDPEALRALLARRAPAWPSSAPQSPNEPQLLE